MKVDLERLNQLDRIEYLSRHNLYESKGLSYVLGFNGLFAAMLLIAFSFMLIGNKNSSKLTCYGGMMLCLLFGYLNIKNWIEMRKVNKKFIQKMDDGKAKDSL